MPVMGENRIQALKSGGESQKPILFSPALPNRQVLLHSGIDASVPTLQYAEWPRTILDSCVPPAATTRPVPRAVRCAAIPCEEFYMVEGVDCYEDV